MKVVAYLRCSTDEQDQSPERQQRFLETWAEQNGYEVAEWIVDEGTSAYKVPPFQRQAFHEAVRAAERHKAKAILVEDLDRFSRGGNREVATTEARLEIEHGLDLVYAKFPDGIEGMALEIIKTVKAEMAREWSRSMSERIAEGLRVARRNGWPKGRPGNRPKPPLTAGERELVERLRSEDYGWRRCAHAISKARGAFDLVDPRRRRELSVSETWLRYMVEHGRKPTTSDGLRLERPKRAVVRTEVDDGSGVRS